MILDQVVKMKSISFLLALGLYLSTISIATCAPQTTITSSSSTSSTSSTSSSTSILRLKANKIKRPESCREPQVRKSEDLPSLVVTGRVKEVHLAGSGDKPTVSDTTNEALVQVNRVIKGNQALVGQELIISNFNASSPSSLACPNYVKLNDSYILLLNQHDSEQRRFVLEGGGSLLSMSLGNLDRINALASNEPYKRRPLIEDILCEVHYCPYGRCVVLDERTNSTTCKCPESCTMQQQQQQQQQAVCGSDGATYASECHLIREGCRLKRPLFVTKEAQC